MTTMMIKFVNGPLDGQQRTPTGDAVQVREDDGTVWIYRKVDNQMVGEVSK